MSEKTNSICICKVIGAHGVHGSVRVRVHSGDAQGVSDYKILWDVHGKDYRVKKVRVVKGDTAVIKLEGLQNRDQAEAFVGTELFVSKAQLPDLADDYYYVMDLIGLKVRTISGEVIDEILAVENHGAGDFITLAKDSTNCIPFTIEAVPEVHLEEGYVVVGDEFLKDHKALS